MFKKLKITGNKSIRGNVELLPSTTIQNFFITLLMIKGGDFTLDGYFYNNATHSFLKKLNEFGVFFDNRIYDISPLKQHTVYRQVDFYSLESLQEKFLFALFFNKLGVTRTKKNQELENIVSYLGFKTEEREGFSVVYNKVEGKDKSINFDVFNKDYFLLSILLLYSNYDSFSITTSDVDEETLLILKILQDTGLITKVGVKFDRTEYFFDKSKFTKTKKMKLYGNPYDLLFFCFLAVFLETELTIKGVDPSIYSESLKILSQFNGNFTIGNNFIKIWGSKNKQYKSLVVNNSKLETKFIRLLCLLIISESKKEVGSTLGINIDIESHSSLVREINMLGGLLEIDVDGKFVYSQNRGLLKESQLSLKNENMFENYVKFAIALNTQGNNTLENVERFLNVSNIVNLLGELGSEVVFEKNSL